jgi:hypothetical protein
MRRIGAIGVVKKAGRVVDWPFRGFREAKGVWTGSWRAPRGTRTGLTEPCGALPRKCLFIYLWVVEMVVRGPAWSFADWENEINIYAGLGRTTRFDLIITLPRTPRSVGRFL